jgi:hypothetical protein
VEGAFEGDATHYRDAIDHGCYAGCEAQAMKVEGEAIAEVDARSRPAAQSAAKCETRLDAFAPMLAEGAG